MQEVAVFKLGVLGRILMRGSRVVAGGLGAP